MSTARCASALETPALLCVSSVVTSNFAPEYAPRGVDFLHRELDAIAIVRARPRRSAPRARGGSRAGWARPAPTASAGTAAAANVATSELNRIMVLLLSIFLRVAALQAPAARAADHVVDRVEIGDRHLPGRRAAFADGEATATSRTRRRSSASRRPSGPIDMLMSGMRALRVGLARSPRAASARPRGRAASPRPSRRPRPVARLRESAGRGNRAPGV